MDINLSPLLSTFRLTKAFFTSVCSVYINDFTDLTMNVHSEILEFLSEELALNH